MDMLWTCIVLMYTFGMVQSLWWTQWIQYCNDSECFDSRSVSCRIGNTIRHRTYCVGDGQTFIERRSSECNVTLCRQWSSEAVVSSCKGNCHNSLTRHLYNCTTLNGCTKTMYKKCLRNDTCMGTWTDYVSGACDAKCGFGTRIVTQRCMKDSRISTSCFGTNGTTYERRRKIECDNCFTQTEWSMWSQCNSSCYKNRTRLCSFGNTSTLCPDKEYKEAESCECYFPPSARKNIPLPSSDNRYFFILIAGGVIGGIVIIFLVWNIIRRKQNKEPKMDDNKTGQIYITEIDRYSPTVDGRPRKTYSFGSHYEILDGSVYSEPFDSVAWKQKRNEAKTTANDIYAAPTRKKKAKSKNTENDIPSYRDSAHMPDAGRTLTFFDEDIFKVLNREEESTKEEPTYSNIANSKEEDDTRRNERNHDREVIQNINK